MECTLFGWAALKPEAQAAWAQAVLSFLAILAAWWLSSRTEKRTLARKVDVYVRLIAMAEAQARGVGLTTPTDKETFGNGKSINDYQIDDFDQYASALRSVALQDLPDHRLLPVVRAAAWGCELMAAYLRQNETAPPGIVDANAIERMEKMRRSHAVLANAYSDAARISDDYAPTLWNRLKHAGWRFARWLTG